MKVTKSSLLIFLILLSFVSFGGIDDVYKKQFSFDFSIIIRVFLSVILTLYFTLKLILARGAVGTLISNHYIFFLYVFVALSSAILNSAPLQSYYFTATLLYPFVVISWINYRSPTENDLIERTVVGFLMWFSLLFLSTLISIIIDPVESLRLNSDFRLRSNLISIGSNGLSWISLVFVLMLLLVRPRLDYKFFLTSIIPVSFIVLTQSRTTLLVIPLIAVYAVYAKGRKRSLMQYLLVGFLSFLTGLLAIGFSDELIQGFTRGETQFASLSGRTLIWEFMLQGFLAKPWLGWGLWNGTDQLLSGTRFEFISQAHSSVVDVAVSTGIVGLTLWLAYFSGIFSLFKVKLNSILDMPMRLRIVSLRLLSIAYLGKIFTSSEMVYADPSFFILVALIFINKRLLSDIRTNRFSANAGVYTRVD